MQWEKKQQENWKREGNGWLHSNGYGLLSVLCRDNEQEVKNNEILIYNDTDKSPKGEENAKL